MSNSNTPHLQNLAVPPFHDRTWLERWPQNRRAALANLFHAAARNGASSPEQIVADVAHDLLRRLAWRLDDERRALCGAVLTSLTENREAALRYAASVAAWEALPYAERQARKAQRSADYQRESMAGKPVTPKQYAFLRALGSQEEPVNRAEASDLIDQTLRA